MEFGVSTFEDTEIHEQIPSTEVKIVSYDPPGPTGEDRVVFDLVNAPASHANALRRTLLAGVPSMALDDVAIDANTGTMPDEVLAHRLGLIPIYADPSDFDYHQDEMTEETANDPQRTILFGLHVIGGEGPDPDFTGVDASWEGRLPPIYTGPSGVVHSGHLVWMPLDGQYDKDIRVLHDDVEITKLTEGQTIHMYIRAIKGTGSMHAKWSPVCTAFYRLLPKITIDPEMKPETKKFLVDTCPMGVFDIEDSGAVRVKDLRKCTMCRECQRHERLKGHLTLAKQNNHYEFTVESLGVRSAPDLVKEALQVLMDKCMKMKEVVEGALQ